MSLKEKDKHTRLLNDSQNDLSKKALTLSLIMTLFLQLILPVGMLVNASSTENDSIEEPTTVEIQAQESEESEKSESTIESPMLMNVEEDDEEVPENVADDSNKEEEMDTEAKENAPPIEETEDSDEEPEEIKEEPKAPGTSEEEEKPEKPSDTKTPPVEEEVQKPEVVEEQEDIEGVEIDEYDPGAMLDGFPARPYDGAPVLIQEFAPGSLGAALPLLQGAKMMQTTNTLGLEPGEVRTSKTATRVPGTVNTWDIKVRIEGRDDNKVKTTDVVLVIDRSGSMDDTQGPWYNPGPTRLDYAKTAANNFIDTMISQDPNLRIAIVSFAQNVTVHGTGNNIFNQNASTLKGRVNGLNASGGTHTQSGILQGRALLNSSTANNKFVVLLSDGQPTYSYRPTNWTNNGGNQYFGIYDGQYNQSATVGDGSNLTQNFWWNSAYRNINNGSAAIRAGQDSRVGINGLFTIAVNAGTEGTPILQQIASPGLAYSTSNPGELQEIYDIIGQQISTQYALRYPTVVDEMGDGFTLIESSITKTEGATSVTAATGSTNQIINWDINPTVTTLVPGTTDVRYAEMTYRVEVNDDILGIPGAKTNDHQLFETNKSTKLTYLNRNDVFQTISIESPKVDPVLLKVKKILKDGYGNIINNDGRRFNVQMSKAAPNGFNHTESLVPGADYVWLTSLRHEGSYSVNETGITGPGETNLNEFNISYNIDGANTTNFVVDHNQTGVPRGDITIQVTNSEIRKIDITATKIWVGGPSIKPDIQLQLLRNSSPQGPPITLASGETSYTWLGLEALDTQGNPYVYTVREVNPPNGYESVADGLTVTNTFIIPTDGIARAKKVWEGGSAEDNYAVDLTLWRTKDGLNFEEVNSTPTITPNSSNTEFSYVWENLAETDISGNEYTFYFTENTVPDGFERIYSNALTVNDIEYGKSDNKVTNRQMLTDFSFRKVDEVGNDLLGATFKLEKHVDGGVNTEINNSGTDPQFLYEGLTIGRYTLTELSAPDGYYLPNDASWTFDVVWDDVTKELTIIFLEGNEIDFGDEGYELPNYPKGLLPDTGGPGIMQSIVMGMFSFVLLSFMYIWRLKRDEVNQND